MAKTIATVGSLVGLAAWEPTDSLAKVARLVAITALVAHLALTYTPGKGGENDPTIAGPKAIGQPAAFLREGAPKEQDVEKRKGLREDEPRHSKGDAREDEPASLHGVRENEPTPFNGSPEGSPVVPRLCAMRAPRNAMPWDAPEFNQPPYAANDDVWISMQRGWVVRIHRSLRTRLFHPVHRSCPVPVADLEPNRFTVIWWSGPYGWERTVQEDTWLAGQSSPLPPVTGPWRGWTLFRLSESDQDGRNSSGMPRIQPDVITWTPDPERAWNMPRQLGGSSGRGRRAQVDPIGRGLAALASMETGQVGRHPADSTGSWSVAGSGGYHGPPTSTASSVSASSRASPPGFGGDGSSAGHSSASDGSALWRPSRMSLRGQALPRGAQVHERAVAPTNRWNEGGTLTIREGETERTAVLRALQAPLPPPLHPSRRRETPEERRDRYHRSNRDAVSDVDLWDFLHGAVGEDEEEDQYYEEAVESEEETSDGSYSQVTDFAWNGPGDESIDR